MGSINRLFSKSLDTTEIMNKVLVIKQGMLILGGWRENEFSKTLNTIEIARKVRNGFCEAYQKKQ